MDKGIFIAALSENATVDGIFVTSDVSRLSDKNGNPYWAFTLCDASGSIPAKIWSQRGVLTPRELPGRAFVHVHGQVGKFRDAMQMRVDTLTVLGEQESAQLNMDDFTPPSPYDGEACMAELMDIVHREVAGTCWERLVAAVFADEGLRRDFATASAARVIHHAGRGGLAAHSLEVCRICLAMADLFPSLDRAILATGALFHDIGKLEEMHTDPFEVTYTVPGSLIGHIVLAITMLQKACEQADIPAAQRDHLFHLILSHHGRVDYGAVKEPSTMEAMVLSTADYLDAKLNTMQGLLDKVAPGELTGLAREFGRCIWRPVPDRPGQGSAEPTQTQASPAAAPAQQPVQAPAQQPARSARTVQPAQAVQPAPQPAQVPAGSTATASAPRRTERGQRTRSAARKSGQAAPAEPGPLPDSGVRGSEMDMPVWEDDYLESLVSIAAGYVPEAGDEDSFGNTAGPAGPAAPAVPAGQAAPSAGHAARPAAQDTTGHQTGEPARERQKSAPLLDLLK